MIVKVQMQVDLELAEGENEQHLFEYIGGLLSGSLMELHENRSRAVAGKKRHDRLAIKVYDIDIPRCRELLRSATYEVVEEEK